MDINVVKKYPQQDASKYEDSIRGIIQTSPELTFILNSDLSLKSANSIERLTGAGSWDAGAWSTTGITGGCYLQFSPNQADQAIQVGINTDAGSAEDSTNIDYSIRLRGVGIPQVRESDVNIGNFGTYVAGDVFGIYYDGDDIVYYFQNNNLITSTSGVGSGVEFYFDSSFNGAGLINEIYFIPVNEVLQNCINSISNKTAICRLSSGAGQSADAVTDVAVQWDTQLELDHGFTHDTVTNNSRIYLDKIGVYLITGALNYNGTTASYRLTSSVSVRLDGATVLGETFEGGYIRSLTGNNETSIAFSLVIRTTAVDQYFEILTKRLSTTTGDGTLTSGTNISVIKF